jgi:asparagine synthase (glutamine-hydrolysing)
LLKTKERQILMSVQYGLLSVAGRSIAPKNIANIRRSLVAYESEATSEYCASDIYLLHLPFQVTPESELEKQPFLSGSGQVVLWDGRLDNRQELIGTLRAELRGDLSDVAIVAAAVDSWGIAALAKLIGDWALSVWNPEERTVLLAKDFLGAKSLYYATREDGFAWSTLIDPLFLCEPRSLRLQEEYLAGWFSHFPAAHLTPFAGIHSVPPSSYVLFRNGQIAVRQYWSFEANKRIFYRDDREYEEHFRTVFGESVRRRLRSKDPILAELSGGMDSSSIVCMADALMAGGFSGIPKVDTISYFENSEPNWNEAPYFEKVEQQRGRAGHHIPVDFRRHWHPSFASHVLAATPDSGILVNHDTAYASHVRSGNYRVLLQGIGGDEVLGGVPTPLPELADLLVRGKVRNLFHQLVAWAVAGKTPALHLLFDTIRQFLPLTFGQEKHSGPPWLYPQFVKRNGKPLGGYARRFHVLSSLPSFEANIAALESLRRQIACIGVTPGLPIERRYPYLDRDLLEYLYAIPREQLVRPNQRRSLMRRALCGIVPPEILNRRRKAFIARAPLVSIRTELPQLLEFTKNMISNRAGIVDAERFQKSLVEAAAGGELLVVLTLRTLLLEAWLSHLAGWADSFNQAPCDTTAIRVAQALTPGLHFSSAEENLIERR